MHSAIAALLLTTLASDSDALRAEQTYYGLERPVMIEIAAPQPIADEHEEDVPVLQLVLLDVDGRTLRGPVSVRPGRTDLSEVLDEFWGLRETTYLQALHYGEPFGSSLVVQPMLAPLVPNVEPATRPDGTPYSRIVGWTITGGDPGVTLRAPRFMGFRVYSERDVLLRTSQGNIRIAMRPDEAPNTVWNFRELVRGGFYRDIIFHRIVPLDQNGFPFVIQAGDPTGTGRGGPGYSIDLEPSDVAHDFGVISMARSDDPNSAGSQFFICLSREGTGRLDGQYTAFGYAVDGAEAILAIAGSELADPASGRPASPEPMIERAELVPAPARIPGQGRPDQPITRHAPERAQPTGRVPR